ncbi:uncharacterized protein LOC132718468 [Ruditapes philippinarum]|uniref:uncharacterized protein LOC132718468 n=1 Tax=Ruditapes philippinarum TaxID=129788 RepID=UPI00295C03EA|nr:uncharacterized protein LOC132718468 [Ruditapes philippinarum]
MWIRILLGTALLYTVEAADCYNKCTSSQICLDDGSCYEQSELTYCGFRWPDYLYCERGHTCCDEFSCCRTGYICRKRNCVVDNSTTRSTQPTRRRWSHRISTVKPKTYSTRRPITLFPRLATNSYTFTVPKYSYSSSTSRYRYRFPIIGGTIVIVSLINVLMCVCCKKFKDQGSRQIRNGRIITTPTNTYLYAPTHGNPATNAASSI